MEHSNFIKPKSKTAVVLCIYVRLENLSYSLSSLAKQTNTDFDVYISNNTNGRHNRKINEVVSKRLSQFNFEVFEHFNQHKQFSRFFVARQLAKEGYERIIFIDDDEVLPTTFIQECYDQYEENLIKSFYGHIVDDDYWAKQKLKKGQFGNYAGTGGLVCSAKFFLNDDFFECPEKYYIIDDLWLSYFALKYTDYRIQILDTNIEFIKDGKATAIGLTDVKQTFYKDYIYGLSLVPYIHG
jgi:GT2 family glycosyltransferase